MKNRVKLEGEELEAYKQKMEEERLEKERLEEERQDLEWVTIMRWLKKLYRLLSQIYYKLFKPSSELFLIGDSLIWPLSSLDAYLSWL